MPVITTNLLSPNYISHDTNTFSQLVGNQYLHLTKCLLNSHIQFYITPNTLTETYTLPKILVHNAIKPEFILSLNFMLSLDDQVNLSREYITINKRSTTIPTNKLSVLSKRGD